MSDERKTYSEWQASGRQVKKGERRGADGKFSASQTKLAARSGRSPKTCKTCGTRINYGVYCGKCEYR